MSKAIQLPTNNGQNSFVVKDGETLIINDSNQYIVYQRLVVEDNAEILIEGNGELVVLG